MLKLRYSYGVTGNQEFSAYQAKTMFQFNTDRLYNSGISAALMGYGNPDLEWQNQYQSNYGFDFRVCKRPYSFAIQLLSEKDRRDVDFCVCRTFFRITFEYFYF